MNVGKKKPAKHKKPSFLNAFRGRVFRWLWAATVVSNVGWWMYNAAAGWLMTSLDSTPLMVSLVQAAASLPMFLFALPAGALADIIDKRRFIVALEVLITLVSVVFALLVSNQFVTAWTLLSFMFLSSTLSALEGPAWQSIVPQLVPKEDLSAAVAANSVGINISRAIGPALASMIIAELGIAAPFWLDAFSNAGVIAVLLWWRPSYGSLRTLPAERFRSALRSGIRYARNNRRLRATLFRAIGFFLFASAYWALLPLVARDQVAGGPELYGVLLGAIGCGALGCAFLLGRLKDRVGANGLAMLGEAGTAITLFLLGLSREPTLAVCASLIAGASWIAVVATLNMSAQLVLARLGSRSRACDVCYRFFRNNDFRQRDLGRNGRIDGTAFHSFHRGRGRALSDSPDATLEVADRCWNRSFALDALA
jgi:MFS family permease